MQNIIQLAWQLASEESRYSHHRYLRWVLGILMVFVITLSQSSSSVQHYLEKNLANLLGADLVVSSTKPLSTDHTVYLAQNSSVFAITQSATATLSHQSNVQQVKLKAVGGNYPVEGTLAIASGLGMETEQVSFGPSTGEIWLDARTLASLRMEIGDTLTVASVPLMVSKVLVHEPDRLMEGHTVQMRGLVHTTTMARFNLPSEHMEHRYLVAANSQQVTRLIEWQKTQLPAASL